MSASNAMKEVSLRLFVSGTSGASRRAIDNLTRLCETALRGRYELEVIDILEQPGIAERAKILATPTLIRQSPEPVCQIIGDLSDPAKVIVGLELESPIRASY